MVGKPMNKRILPKANKTKLIKLLRAKGFSVPSIQQAEISHLGRTYWLRWRDKDKLPHVAYYSGSVGRPVLQVDKQWLEISMEEVRHFGLYEEK